jgi:hypothetical protein
MFVFSLAAGTCSRAVLSQKGHSEIKKIRRIHFPACQRINSLILSVNSVS